MARALVSDEWLTRVRGLVAALPEVVEERAWTGIRWVVKGSTFAHVFGGEDQLLRLTFRAEMSEVAAFEHLGHPYFRVGGNAVGLVLPDDAGDVDLTELRELLVESYCVQAPTSLAEQVDRPDVP